MFSIRSNLNTVIGDFHLDRMLRCSVFAQRLCCPGRWLGCVAGRIMPSRASCPDENQGFPVIQASPAGHDPDMKVFGSARSCLASGDPLSMLPAGSWPDDGRMTVGRHLVAGLFCFKRDMGRGM